MVLLEVGGEAEPGVEDLLAHVALQVSIKPPVLLVLDRCKSIIQSLYVNSSSLYSTDIKDKFKYYVFLYYKFKPGLGSRSRVFLARSRSRLKKKSGAGAARN